MFNVFVSSPYKYFNAAKGNAPTSRNLNAVDLYLIVCIGLVFIALMEFALVLLWSRKNETKIKEEKKDISSNDAAKSASTNDASIVNVTKNGWMQKPPEYNSLDKISIFAFPIFFIVFNMFYFILYL